MTFDSTPDHRGSAAQNANEAPLTVRESESLCMATGLGLMTTGDPRSLAKSLDPFASGSHAFEMF